MGPFKANVGLQNGKFIWAARHLVDAAVRQLSIEKGGKKDQHEVSDDLPALNLNDLQI